VASVARHRFGFSYFRNQNSAQVKTKAPSRYACRRTPKETYGKSNRGNSNQQRHNPFRTASSRRGPKQLRTSSRSPSAATMTASFSSSHKWLMIQVAIPRHGPSGESAWGGRFNDEINASSAVYQTGYKAGTVAMANAGPNTNARSFSLCTSIIRCRPATRSSPRHRGSGYR